MRQRYDYSDNPQKKIWGIVKYTIRLHFDRVWVTNYLDRQEKTTTFANKTNAKPIQWEKESRN